jgi:choline kinase
MKAFIFNSGVGSRLGDLTKDKPKALVELKSGETILGRQLRILRSQGIKEYSYFDRVQSRND